MNNVLLKGLGAPKKELSHDIEEEWRVKNGVNA
jgi:hypothetical protein